MLRPRKHISKKELKEDKLVIFYAQATAWLENYKSYLIGGIVGLVVMALAVFFYLQSSEASEKTASVELAKATRAYESADLQTAIPMLSNLVKNYGRTTSGKVGRFYLANAFFQNKDYDNAKTNYEKFISSFRGDEHFVSSAQGGIAACLEEKKQYAAAAQTFSDAAEKYKKSVMAPQLLFKAGRCYLLAGKVAQGKAMFQQVVEKFPKSTEKDDALLQLSLLGQ